MTRSKKQNKKSAKPTTISPPRSSNGTAILGVVISELTICGVFDVTDTEARYIAKGIETVLLSKFHVELLEAAGFIKTAD